VKWSKEAQRVHQTILQAGVLDKDQALLLAVSGGRDSAALLHIFIELHQAWRWKLLIGHINHGLRPDADTAESDWCRAIASQYQLPYFEKSLSEADFDAVAENSSLEAKARILRYAILETWRQEAGAHYILTGHHRDDQAETVLYRFFRGSGWRGLAGISAFGENLIRPLLALRRADITAYCAARHISYFDDRSNEETRLKRNLIRHELLPQIEKGFPDAVNALSALADSMQNLSAYIDAQTDGFLQENLENHSGFIRLSRNKLLALPTILQQAAIQKLAVKFSRDARLSQKQLAQLLNLIANGQNSDFYSIASGIFFFIESNDFVITNTIPQPLDLPLDVNRDLTLPHIGILRLELLPAPPQTFPKNDAEKIILSSREILDFKVRSWKKGDRLHPFGEKKSQLVSNLLTKGKIPAYLRINYPIVLTNDAILWIPGIRRGSIFPVAAEACYFYQICFISSRRQTEDMCNE
jgi:tRNA(Ile)-lysidine synthase